MNQENLGNNLSASGGMPLKRKRGRPRKYPVYDRGQIANHSGGSAVPPGFNSRHTPCFGRANGNRPRSADQVHEANDIAVGQTVFGVVEAVFDAGCLVSVRVKNSETILRGVVFRPGQYVPVSAENDVAPNLSMIQRHEVSFPTVDSAEVPGAGERDQQDFDLPGNGTAHSVNASSSKFPQTANLAITSSVMVPAEGSKDKQVAESTPTDQPTVQIGLPSEPQTNYQETSGEQNGNSFLNQSAEVAQMSLDQLVDEAMKRVESPESADRQVEISKSPVKSPAKESTGDHFEGEAEFRENPPFIATLQRMETVQHNFAAPVPNPEPLGNSNTDRMSELLRVLQDNMAEEQGLEAQNLAPRSFLKSGEQGPDLN